MYEVETRVLKQAVRRNIDRFPDDFMFQLTPEEYISLRSQFVMLKKLDGKNGKNSRRGKHSKFLPFAFTEQGVAMLSGILNSKRAIEVNIAIMRTFVQLRKLMQGNIELTKKIEALEKKYQYHDKQFQLVFEAIKQLIKEEKKPRRQMGFR